MATVIKIHGTFSSGPEDGTAWWQRGSAFERDIRTFVESEDGSLQIEALPWDGKNRETSRRSGAAKLLDRCTSLETNEKYVIVAHSHGGSVVSQAIRESVKAERSLQGLSTWITVGTPFLRMSKRGWLISRLTSIQQTIYLSIFLCVATTCLTAAAMLLSGYRLDAFYIFFVGAPVGVLLVTHFFLAQQDKHRLATYSKALEGMARQVFGDRAIPFWHRDDEAISALKSIVRTRLRVFHPEIFLGFLLGLYMIALPLASVGVLVYFGSRCPLLGETCPHPNPISSPAWLSNLYSGLWYFLGLAERPRSLVTLVGATTPEWEGAGWWLGTVVAFLISVGAYVLISLGFFLALRKIAFLGSTWLSRWANGLTGRQIVEMTYGNDDIGLTGISCSPHPFEAMSTNPIPDELSGLLKSLSDMEAAETVGKLRIAIGDLIANAGSSAGLEVADRYLSWSELIHTSYFSEPMFRKLLCYTIAHSPGFRPSETLKGDPDYVKLGQWLSAIRGLPMPHIVRPPKETAA